PVVDPELVGKACLDAVSLINEAHPGNENMEMVHQPDMSAFKGALDTYFGRKLCTFCGNGRLVATTSKDGLSIQCDGQGCKYRSPALGSMPISAEKYPRLGNFFMVVNQQFNLTLAAEPTASWTAFQGEEHVFIPGNPDLNRLFVHSLSGNNARVAALITAVCADEAALVENEWWSFEPSMHRWIQRSENAIIDKTIGSKRVYDLYEAACSYYQREAVRLRGDAEATQRAKWVREMFNQLDKTSFRNAVIERMKSHYEMQGLSFVKLRDRLEHILAFDNGVIDLDSQSDGCTYCFRPGRPDDYVTITTGYDFDYERVHDRALRAKVEDVLAKILPDAAVRNFMLTYAATMLSGTTREQKLVFLVGNGANGKSLVVNALKSVLGGYAQTVKSALLISGGAKRDVEAASPVLAQLRTARAVFVTEVGENSHLDEEIVKSLTGDDDISARALHKAPVQYRPQFKLCFPVNTAPKFSQGSSRNTAMPRRLLYVAFSSQFVESEERVNESKGIYLADNKLGARVKTPEFSLPLLGLLLDRYDIYARDGLRVPLAVLSATNEYVSQNDTLAVFFTKATRAPRPSEAAGTPTVVLFEAYKTWLRVNAPDVIPMVQSWTQTKFTQSMPEQYTSETLRFAVDGSKDVKKVRGVRILLKTQDEMDDDEA
ncbi:hypothetical protein HDU93_009192, partial [Gonapodya sp. JEL0774]